MGTRAMSDEIEGLRGLDLDILCERFQSLYSVGAPKHLSHDLLSRAIAHRMQVQAYGDLKPVVRRQLKQMTDALRKTGRIALPDRPPVKPGTRLLRDWQGETYEVMVLEEGFAYGGEVYGSLSRIAGEITGAKWSGPAFFGLKARETG